MLLASVPGQPEQPYVSGHSTTVAYLAPLHGVMKEPFGYYCSVVTKTVLRFRTARIAINRLLLLLPAC